jgi:DNA polymerase III alpha subunit
MAWYKAYHRPAFTTAVLQYDSANAQTYILDAVAHDVEVVTPNINTSTQNYELSGNAIYLPLTEVAFLGDNAIEFILHDRETNGPYSSYEDFAARVPKRKCNSRARGMLERIGAFKGLSGDPTSAIEKYTELPVLSDYQNQLEILSYIIPTKETYSKIEKLRNTPAKKGYTRFAGFVAKIENKKSSHGEYTVYTLSPNGSFWVRSPKAKLTIGMFVSGTKSKFGHSGDVKVYRMS